MVDHEATPIELRGLSSQAASDYGHLSPSELVQAVASSNAPEAWEAFVVRFHPFLSSIANAVGRRFTPSPVEAPEDFTQDIYQKLCARGRTVLKDFRPSHPNSGFAYLQSIAVRQAIDRLRARRSAKRSASLRSLTEADERSFAHDRGAAASRAERRVLLREIDEIFTRAPSSPRDRRIFWLYYRTGLEASAIARLPGIGLSTKGVESAVFRLTRIVREAVSELPRA